MCLLSLAGFYGQHLLLFLIRISLVDIWTILHDMGKFPSVFCIDSSGDEIVGDIKHTSVNIVTVTFAFPTGGKAFLN